MGIQYGSFLLKFQFGVEAAELGDHKRGLSSDDLPRIQKVRVPCLLNSAACHIKLGTKTDLTKALGWSVDPAVGCLKNGSERTVCTPIVWLSQLSCGAPRHSQ